MRIVLAIVLIASAAVFAWAGSEQFPGLPPTNKYAEMESQWAARALALIGVAFALGAGLLL